MDRVDRRVLIAAVDAGGPWCLAGLAVAAGTGTATVPLVYAASLLPGAAETLADTAAGSPSRPTGCLPPTPA